MKRMLIALVALTLAAGGALAAAGDDKPNFSGTWTYDASKSQAPQGQAGRARAGGGGGAGGGARGGRGAALGLTPPEGPVTVTQTADQITIGAQTFKFDGSPTTLGGGGGRRGGSGTAKARWDGSKLVIETTISARGNSMTSTEVRTLASDGKEMIVERTVSTPRGELKAKQVFTKS
jgi:type 1 fimbria pilin